MSALTPPAMYAALAAAAAPEAPKNGISAKSRPIPTPKHTAGATDDRLGNDEATNAFEKTINAVNPSSPGSSSRNGVTEALKDAPKTTGISGGARTALASRLASVTNQADRKARNVCPRRGPASLRAATGRSAVETAPGK